MPTATQMDELERQVRREEEPEYARLAQMRTAGQLSPGEYEVQKQSLDLRVQNKVDNMVWSRHALAQSNLKSMGMPTPDLPVSNLPPGVGTVQGSLYNSTRLNGLGNQMQSNYMQNLGTSSFQKGVGAGTAYDP
ncbi:MAG: hypothetical protein NTV80_01295 [Verrucomicrobia bacterium]|nr:hypothetical protein [Verrucomicrobiota bacterium]